MDLRWNYFSFYRSCFLNFKNHLTFQEEREHGLRVGMRVEAADLMDPRLICVATIAQVNFQLVSACLHSV